MTFAQRAFLRLLGQQIDGGRPESSVESHSPRVSVAARRRSSLQAAAPTVVDPPYGVAGGGDENGSAAVTPAPLDYDFSEAVDRVLEAS